MQFHGKCYKCEIGFLIEQDNPIIHFTKGRKYDYRDYKCSNCGYKQKVALFSKKSNLLTVFPT